MRHIHPDSPEAIAQDIDRFIRQRFEVAHDDPSFDRKVNLWEEGYVDSLGVVEVIEFLERRFRVRLPEDVVFSSEFTSIDGIARYLVKLRTAG